jgi:hypothetical protein
MDDSMKLAERFQLFHAAGDPVDGGLWHHVLEHVLAVVVDELEHVRVEDYAARWEDGHHADNQILGLKKTCGAQRTEAAP